MMRIPRTALLLASALLWGARAADAQTITSPMRPIVHTQNVQVFAGYLFPERSVGLTDSTAADLGPQAAPLFGIRYNLRASGPLSVDGSVGVSPSSRRLYGPDYVADSTRVEATDLGVEVPATLVMADVGLRFHLTGPRTWNGIAPFVVGMGGLVGDVSGTSAEEEEEEQDLEENERFRFGPSFAVGAGLGTDWFPTQNLSLRLELQGRLWRMETPEGFTIPRAERSEWNRVGVVTVGGAFHF